MIKKIMDKFDKFFSNTVNFFSLISGMLIFLGCLAFILVFDKRDESNYVQYGSKEQNKKALEKIMGKIHSDEQRETRSE